LRGHLRIESKKRKGKRRDPAGTEGPDGIMTVTEGGGGKGEGWEGCVSFPHRET